MINSEFVSGVNVQTVRFTSIVSWSKVRCDGHENASNSGNKSAKRLWDGNGCYKKSNEGYRKKKNVFLLKKKDKYMFGVLILALIDEKINK